MEDLVIDTASSEEWDDQLQEELHQYVLRANEEEVNCKPVQEEDLFPLPEESSTPLFMGTAALQQQAETNTTSEEVGGGDGDLLWCQKWLEGAVEEEQEEEILLTRDGGVRKRRIQRGNASQLRPAPGCKVTGTYSPQPCPSLQSSPSRLGSP